MFKTIFHLYNIIIIFLFVFPGSFLGLVLNNDISKEPAIFPDFIFSLNHFYAFFLLSSLGLIGYYEKSLKIIIYLISASIILELIHLFLPVREFQYSDMIANIVGILVPIILLILFKFWKKK